MSVVKLRNCYRNAKEKECVFEGKCRINTRLTPSGESLSMTVQFPSSNPWEKPIRSDVRISFPEASEFSQGQCLIQREDIPAIVCYLIGNLDKESSIYDYIQHSSTLLRIVAAETMIGTGYFKLVEFSGTLRPFHTLKLQLVIYRQQIGRRAVIAKRYHDYMTVGFRVCTGAAGMLQCIGDAFECCSATALRRKLSAHIRKKAQKVLLTSETAGAIFVITIRIRNRNRIARERITFSAAIFPGSACHEERTAEYKCKAGYHSGKLREKFRGSMVQFRECMQARTTCAILFVENQSACVLLKITKFIA